MYEAVFRVRSGASYEVATTGTDTTIELWCNDHCDLLHVSGTDGGRVIREVDETVGIRERLDEGTEQVVITQDCLKTETDDFVEQYLARHDCLLVPPIRYARGAKHCRTLALDGDSLTDFYLDISSEYEVTVEMKREVQSVVPNSPLLTVDALLPNLSPRQGEVFATAHRLGYYELPRETTTEEIAGAVGIKRRTAEDHLRRAEKKMVDELVEYL